MPPTRTTGHAASRPATTKRSAFDLQRRRREVALTATWLRELRGSVTGGVGAAGRFVRNR